MDYFWEGFEKRALSEKLLHSAADKAMFLGEMASDAGKYKEALKGFTRHAKFRNAAWKKRGPTRFDLTPKKQKK